jgi:hypothetical protein
MEHNYSYHAALAAPSEFGSKVDTLLVRQEARLLQTVHAGIAGSGKQFFFKHHWLDESQLHLRLIALGA